MDTQVSWRDYEGLDNFYGSASASEVEDLNKALAAGSAINAPTVAPGEGFPLRVESLEKTLKNTTYKMDHIRLFKNITKIPAYNTVEEHNELNSYGVNNDSAFIAEGDLPQSDDSTYARRYAVVKFLGTTRKVTHVMSLVKPAVGNVIAQETINGTMHLLKQLERAMFYGDSSLSPLQFDGFIKLIQSNAPASNIIDLRGRPLSEDILTDASLTVQDAPNYGTPTHFFCNPKVKADLVKAFFPKERYDAFKKTNDGIIGLDIKGFTSPAGDVLFEPDVFMTDGGGPVAATGDATLRPSTPTISTAVSTPTTTNSNFISTDVGTYAVKVQAVNRYGRSAAVTVSTAQAVAAGQGLSFGVTPGAVVPDYYEVFRSAANGAAGTERSTLRVANAAGAAESVIVDKNDNIPYCSSAILFQLNDESVSFKQLAPMIKIPLGTIDASIRWMQLIYGVPVLYTPGKNVLIKNIGRALGYVGAI